MSEDERLAGAGLGFVVAGEAAGLHEPAEGALDQPALGLDLEAFGRGIAALDDFQTQVWMRSVSAQLCWERAAGIAGIGKEHFEPWLSAKHAGQDFERPRAIGDTGRRHRDAQDQPEGVHDQMPFSPSDLFACIVAAHSGVVSHLKTLRIEDRSAGEFFFALFSRTAARNSSLSRTHSPLSRQQAK